MRQINLLPSDQKPGKKVWQILKKYEKYFVILVILYITFVSVSVYYILELGKEQKELTREKSALSSEIKSLSNIESSTVYIRDRVNKYRNIPGRGVELDNLNRLEQLNLILTPSIVMENIEILDNSLKFDVEIKDTQNLVYFLNKIVEANLYKNITLSTIAYSENVGYKFGLNLDF